MPIDSPETRPIESQQPLPLPKDGRTPEPEGVKAQWDEIGGLVERQKAELDAQSAQILELKASKERYVKGYRTAKGRIDLLRDKIEEISRARRETSETLDQRVRALEGELKHAKALLAMKSTDLSALEPFFRLTDGVAEDEVLFIVRDLNEHIFQVAANLTDGWEKLRSQSSYRKTITDEEVEAFSQSYGPVLVQKVHRRSPTAVTYLIQSCFCDLVTQFTSSWRHNKELSVLASVYKRLSATEGQGIPARWRSLAHSRLPEPPSRSDPIALRIADVLWITGLFQSKQRSFDFVKEKEHNNIETIDRLAVRLEFQLMVNVVSSDMCLLFESPCAVFDGTRMVGESESYGGSTPGEEDKVVGTTEVGVEQSVRKRGERPSTKVLLKTKVILEKDLADL